VGRRKAARSIFAEQVAERLREAAAELQADLRILGPAPAPLAKLRGKFRFHTLVQGQDRDLMRRIVRQTIEGLKAVDEIQWVVDVDPLDLL